MDFSDSWSLRPCCNMCWLIGVVRYPNTGSEDDIDGSIELTMKCNRSEFVSPSIIYHSKWPYPAECTLILIESVG